MTMGISYTPILGGSNNLGGSQFFVGALISLDVFHFHGEIIVIKSFQNWGEIQYLGIVFILGAFIPLEALISSLIHI